MKWHSLPIEEILKQFNVKVNTGLSNAKIINNRKKYGLNKLEIKKNKGIFSKFIAQFKDVMIIILLFAAGISFATSIIDDNSDYIDSIIILFIVLMNAIIGVIQENKAEKAIEALKKLTSPKTKVIRSGKEFNVLSSEIFPGDIVKLEAGSIVPADCRLIKSVKFITEESILTGESLSVNKDANIILKPQTQLAEQKNMAFSGTTVVSGHALAIVVETGMNTQVGKIANMLTLESSPQTPLQKKLEKTSKILGLGVTAICAIILILGLIQKIPFLDMFMIAISLAVAAIPEGLPAVVTIVLAMGIRKMAANKAIIRKLPAVETLGSATVICSDKTGTLTQNRMSVTKISNGDSFVNFSSSDGKKILELCSLCNDSKVVYKGNSFKILGEPTEKALLDAYLDLKLSKNDLDKKYKRVEEFPFDSKRKLMTTIHKISEGKFRVVTKGAPDVLLNIANRSENSSLNFKINFRKQNDMMAKNAMRVLAVAYKDVNEIPKSLKEAESNLTICGLVGMIDTPRAEAKLAVADCKKAGIKPVMITGDHIITAKAIAKELGIYKSGDLAATGEDLNSMDDNALIKNIFKYSVFARVSPEHKVRIVKAFKKKGAIVAMTGDGVNDAPALKAADIGCAMGKSGTDVAKNASDMILTDDNFSTIVKAVKQGRGISQNIRKTVHFLISSNIGEIVTVLTAFLLKLPTPLLAIQLLWVNLVTDTFPALALGVEPIDGNVMDKKPEKTDAGLFSRKKWKSISLEGCFIGAISILAFTLGRILFDTTAVPVVGRTMAFAVLSLSQIVHAFNVRSEKSIFKSQFFNNMKIIYSFILCVILQVSVISLPSLSLIFKTANLNFMQWSIVAILSLSPLAVVEFEKAAEK